VKIFEFSDSHLDFHYDGGESFLARLPLDAVDVVVIAGDFGTVGKSAFQDDNLQHGLRIVADRAKQIVYVTGNHEYYDTRRERVHQVLREFAATHPNFHWLHNSEVEIDGHRFVGTTMWFREDPSVWSIRHRLNDFNLIPEFDHWVYKDNARAVGFLRHRIRKGDIVVTHHVPHPGCISRQYQGDPMNAFYLCDMVNEIRRLSPAIWFHGHIHESRNFMVGDTQILANPYGYSGHGTNNDFQESLIVSV
jgi:Icc-related predicted phosphoesterase